MKNYALTLEVTRETEINEQAASNLDPETPESPKPPNTNPQKDLMKHKNPKALES